MFNKIKGRIEDILSSGSINTERPLIKKNNGSNIPGVYIIGDLAGAPVIKFAMKQGYDIIEHISSLSDAKGNNPEVYDVIIVGAGAAGLNAALAAQEKGMSCVVLEKSKIANTIENFPEGKWVYAEPDDHPPKGKLWLDGSTKEELIKRWHEIIQEQKLDVRSSEELKALKKHDGIFTVTSSKSQYQAKRIVLATGQRGNPKTLNVPGEDQEKVYHHLYSPKKYHDKSILVVGGGNSAVEAAITLCERNKVYLSYRQSEFNRVFKDNDLKLKEKLSEGKIELILNSEVQAFGDHKVILKVQGSGPETQEIAFDYAFVLIGAEIPRAFLRSLGIRMENEWTGSILRSAFLSFLTLFGLWIFGGHASIYGYNFSHIPHELGIGVSILSLGALIYFGVRKDRYAWLGLAFLISYSIYGIKTGSGMEFWPYTMWGNQLLSFFDRPWSFWYTVLYTTIMTIFGIKALMRWGLKRQDSFQIWRYISLIGFQWFFFFIIPELLFQWAVEYQWVGQALANDPTFADQSGRAYGIIYAWPLFFYTFFFNPHQIWVIWGVFLTFVLIPIFVIWNGKRYCSWICGCGGLAETLGDQWRHLAPKGKTSIRWEKMNIYILSAAIIVTLAILLKDVHYLITSPAEISLGVYKILADVWLVGIIPVTLYPFMGGKVWCRYWCPLAKLMHIMSKITTRLGMSRFGISSNQKCIGCQECSRNCQVGIDVMGFALKQEVLDNVNSTCIGCGVCVSVCPMDVLSFGRQSFADLKQLPVIQH
ncbi:MAG: pyridine nucleotide-disulfide oxidoreductase [bacterium]|nr:MAG: pyridine nucleotide-disulfide oxidoreductase [bacterium]